MKVGNQIREARKKLGLNMKEFARRIGVSYLTLYRVETDKVSPSVVLLSDIAHQLNQPLVSFFEDRSNLTIVRAGTAPTVESEKMKLDLLLPKGVIDPGISVSLGETDGGEFISDHSHKGFELAYQILGKTRFRYGKEDWEINEGDLLYFDSSITHSVTALGHAKFLTIYFRK
jgi:transcriptional regulator with XRE-family HTH domain